MRIVLIKDAYSKQSIAFWVEGRSSDRQYSRHTSPKSLADDFGQSFFRKIGNVRSELDAMEMVEDTYMEPVNYTMFVGAP